MFKITDRDKLIHRLEADNKKRIQAFLKTLKPDGFFFTIPQNKLSKAGIADTLGIYNGIPFAIEIKSLDGKPTSLQKVFLRSVVRSGGMAGIARCVADVKLILGCSDWGVTVGIRNHAAFTLATVWREFMSPKQILTALIHWNRKNNTELPESELERITETVTAG